MSDKIADLHIIINHHAYIFKTRREFRKSKRLKVRFHPTITFLNEKLNIKLSAFGKSEKKNYDCPLNILKQKRVHFGVAAFKNIFCKIDQIEYAKEQYVKKWAVLKRMQIGDEAAYHPKSLKLWQNFEAIEKINKTGLSLATQ
uniref:Uncharacterized protein n=1 Tax=Onchocerca volvulus TaxID=6282 RepID=A0A8R1TNE1_ONCVO